MKVNALCVAAGLAGSLILTAAASAAYTGLVVEVKAGAPAGLNVFNIWACFTNPGDRLLSITQATITTVDGATLFQHAFGTSTAPNSAFFPLPGFEQLPFDSFVTIGLKSIPVGGTDATSLEPGAAFSAGGFTGGWFNSNPDNDQGAPGAHGAPASIQGGPIPAGTSYVLIAQLTLQGTLTATQGVQGDMLVAWKAAGGAAAEFAPGSFNTVPAPAVLALIGLAGLASRRRRA